MGKIFSIGLIAGMLPFLFSLILQAEDQKITDPNSDEKAKPLKPLADFIKPESGKNHDPNTNIIDELIARSEAGESEAQFNLGHKVQSEVQHRQMILCLKLFTESREKSVRKGLSRPGVFP